MEHGVQMAEEDGEAGERHRPPAERGLAGPELGQEHRQPALAAIAQERDRRGGFLSRAQHVGGARVLRTVAARVGQREQPAHHDRERHRAEKVSAQDDECGLHGSGS